MVSVTIFSIASTLTLLQFDDVKASSNNERSSLSPVSPDDHSNPCILPPDPGPCQYTILQYYYNSHSQSCRQFIYGGCEGNENRFQTEEQCNTSCSRSTISYVSSNNAEILADVPTTFSNGEENLKLLNSTGQSSFTFSKGSPLIQLNSEILKSFQLRDTRDISFEFRTSDPKGLFLFHTLANRPNEDVKYELYVTLEGGELKVIHVFGAEETTVLVGKALNTDVWHKTLIMIDPASGVLKVTVDDATASTLLQSLRVTPFYSVTEDVDSVMFIGGMDTVQDGMESSYLFEHFVGCLRNIRLRGGPSESELSYVTPFTAAVFRDIKEGCIDRCLSEGNACRNGGRCINLYDRTECDCFGTNYEGENCDRDVPTVLTLRGYSYLSYRIYDWKDRVHSKSNRISMLFKSLVGDSVLFYAGGTFPETNHIALTLLKNGSLYVEVDFGNEPQSIVLEENLINGEWHNITAIHEGRTVALYLNGKMSGTISVTGEKYYLRFDPHIYVGGDRKPIGPGLLSTNNFAGCLSEVYVNHINILYGLRSSRPQAAYHGILTPEFQACEEVKDIPVTFPFAESEIQIDGAVFDNRVHLILNFKTSQKVAVLAYGHVVMDVGTEGYWEVRLVRGEVQFMVIPDANNETNFYIIARTGRKLADDSWHFLKIGYEGGLVSLNADDKYKIKAQNNRTMDLAKSLVIGTSLADPHLGMVGCMKKIFIDGKEQDPRLLVKGKVREVSLDNCQLVDPCKRPNACEHGGRCMVDDGRVVCDCTGTGYTGKNCHFALYKRTCEELALLGYHKSGVYEIDIDGNGPHPPAHVLCQFEPSGARKTVVDHNLPTDMEVRSKKAGNILIKLTYREFTPDMLQSLISQSLQCRQHIRYDCYKAPLELHSYTWFRSSSGAILDYLGATKPGRCPCATDRKCAHPGLYCNCDGNENKWRSDEGYLTRPQELGITEIFALQPKKLSPSADGRITLGPLECVEANTQQYVVTFKSSDSYMEVPGWRTGDLAFSFRTSSESGILLYQAMLHPKHPYFRVLFFNDELTLEFSLNGVPRSVTVKSSRDLNSGEWQQVWIDYNEYHVRFTVNQESILLDLKDGEEFGPFEATLYIGGAPEEMLQRSNHTEGLIGCYRGLVMNNEVVNLYAYMNARFPDMIQKHCLPSCDPNPCQNDATCVEFWGSYKCICQNPLAHFGHNCETNINKNALTFRSRGTFVEANATSKIDAHKFGLFRFFSEDILLNIRTFDTSSLVLYAYDYMNNFVQLHTDQNNKVVFTFNSEDIIQQVATNLEDLGDGDEIQILIKRKADSTTLQVNGANNTVNVPFRLLTKYKRNPWQNPQLETIKPPRPVRQPEEFYQVFLGGIDGDYMETELPGFIGCLRGLKLGSQSIDLMSPQSHDLAQDISLHGVALGCSMLCDNQPCQNGGRCSEDLATNTFTCDCEFTSYFGDVCTEERGASFGGDSYIYAKHKAKEFNNVQVQFAFSTPAVRNIAQALLLIQTGNDNTKYLLVTLTHLGYLRIEEDRGDGVVFGAEIKNIHFLNGARHSIFYRRKGNVTHLKVDRSEIPIRPLSTSIHINLLADVTDTNAIHVGGIKHTSDPRFSDYDKFDGCLSNVYIELDGERIEPLLIYLGYQEDHDAVTSNDPDDIEEEARCAAFSVTPPGVNEIILDSGNETDVGDWSPSPPEILPYREKVLFDRTSFDASAMNRLLVGIGVVFLVLIIFVSLYMWRLNLTYKRRKEEEDEPLLFHPPVMTTRQPTKSSIKPTHATKDAGVTTHPKLEPKKNRTNSFDEYISKNISSADYSNLAKLNGTVGKEFISLTHTGTPEIKAVEQARQQSEGEDASLSSTKDNLSAGYTDDTADIDVLNDAKPNENIAEDLMEHADEDKIVDLIDKESTIEPSFWHQKVIDYDLNPYPELQPIKPLDKKHSLRRAPLARISEI